MTTTRSNTEHSPLDLDALGGRTADGPWSFKHNSWSDSSVCDATGKLVCVVRIDPDVDEDSQPKFEALKESRAESIAALPAIIALARTQAAELERMRDGLRRLEKECGPNDRDYLSVRLIREVLATLASAEVGK